MLLNSNQRFDKLIEEQGKRTNLLETNIKNMKVQIGQIAQELYKRPQEGLRSDIVINPKGKEQCHAVTLKSGKQVHNPVPAKSKASRIREEITQ